MLRTVTPVALAALVATLTLLTSETSRAQGTQPTPSAAESTVTERATTISRSLRNSSAEEPTPPTALVAPPTPSVDDARTYAFEQIGAAQFDCLDALWQHESDWNPAAENPSSGAYGIPQALPAGQLATFGSDWPDNPLTQVRWGLWYIKVSYGSPCNAWSFWQRHYPHWY